jgi:hypothetical protein
LVVRTDEKWSLSYPLCNFVCEPLLDKLGAAAGRGELVETLHQRRSVLLCQDFCDVLLKPARQIASMLPMVENDGDTFSNVLDQHLQLGGLEVYKVYVVAHRFQEPEGDWN